MTLAIDTAALTAAMRRAEVPQTVSELADSAGLSPSGAYRVMKALERRGEAEKAGVALNGGQTWRLTETGGVMTRRGKRPTGVCTMCARRVPLTKHAIPWKHTRPDTQIVCFGVTIRPGTYVKET